MPVARPTANPISPARPADSDKIGRTACRAKHDGTTYARQDARSAYVSKFVPRNSYAQFSMTIRCRHFRLEIFLQAF
jgi:hypothetical protein